MSWRYGVLEIRNTKIPGSEMFPIQFIDFDSAEPTAFERPEEAFRRSGAENWELVSVIYIDDEQASSEKVTRHFCKRPGGIG